ncbi:MAG: hypothetical protein K5872_07485 [Rhizobiaceae bacterium]|nr:hypothetical protein [Rhizobiaceae bacterium]MCV0406055.1 hypothetical protein [Rhizobiaceae bacterium]
MSERALGRVVEHYVDTRTRGFALVSTRHAVRAIRAAMPRLDLSDRQLADMVADIAVRRGHGVAFDLEN